VALLTFIRRSIEPKTINHDSMKEIQHNAITICLEKGPKVLPVALL
jgi:hypothetical protein